MHHSLSSAYFNHFENKKKQHNSSDMLCALFLIDLIIKKEIGDYFKNENIFAQSLPVHFKEIVSTISNVWLYFFITVI